MLRHSSINEPPPTSPIQAEIKRQYTPEEGELSDPEELLQARPLLEGNQENYNTPTKPSSRQSHRGSNKVKRSGPQGRVKTFNEDEETTKIIQLTYLQFSYAKVIIVVPILSLLTALFFLLFLYWYPKLRKTFFYSECTDVMRATHLFIEGTLGHMEVVKIENRNAELRRFISPQAMEAYNAKPFLTFTYRFIKYEYDNDQDIFNPIIFNCAQSFQTIHNLFSGGIQNNADYQMQLIKYGKCNIDVPIKSIPRLLIEEVLNPFYIFQIFSMALWYWDGYVYYAFCIMIISVTSAVTSLVETLSNLKNIRKMANYTCQVKVMRSGDENVLNEIDSSDLVPGDVIEIPENTAMPCDLILLTGSCIVNESMLTGESIPVIKNSLPFTTTDIYNPEDDAKFTLYGGTKVIQTRRYGNSKVLGVVIRTAFVTTKGNLVRDILYPKPNKFKFYQDSLKFIFVMGIIAILGFLTTLPMMIDQGLPVAEIVDRSLDLITITVPPALPAAMTAGAAFAIARLKKRKIFCISPPRVNVAGRVNLMVFDKTGTLTEDGLTVFGFRGTESAVVHNKPQSIFGQFSPNCKNFQPNRKWWTDALEKEELIQDPRTLFLESLASCHSITYVNGELIGDPLDVKMFQATGWILEEQTSDAGTDELVLAYVRPPLASAGGAQRADSMLSISDMSDEEKQKEANYQIALIRRFDFSSKLQRMSVIVKNFLDQSFKTFVKGSPERIRELCRPETLPQNFDEILEIYTECGYRVLAIASKPLNISYLKSQKVTRDEIEFDLQFLGFLVMQNKLKPITTDVIQTLNQANIRTIMATGDNVLTAISVGRQCNIIEADAEVFLGDVKKEGDKEVVFWRSTKSGGGHKMNVGTLQPDQDFFQDEAKKLGYNAHIKSELEQSRHENEESVNDIVGLQDFPWQHPPDSYAVAITGKAFNVLLTDPSQQAVLKQVLIKSQIYARMSPDDKAKLVENLQDFCKTEVGMCGDGANDCGALKQADVGLSLSEAEASIAAPFTSQIQDISSVVILLREGRCALTTSFQCFKFIELYSMIQFVSVTLLYSIGNNLTDGQFLYIDLFMLIPLSIFMGRTEAYRTLTPHLPSGSLLSLPVLTSVLGSVVIQLGFQFFIFFFVRHWDFYKPFVIPDEDESNTPSYENTAINFIANFQYLVVCMVFSISKPFRQPLYSNLWFTLSLILLLAFNTYINLSDDPFVTKLLMYEADVSMTFRLATLIVVVINSILTYGFERIIVWYVSLWYKSRQDRKIYLKQRQEIQEQQQMQKLAIEAQRSDFAPLMLENLADDSSPAKVRGNTNSAKKESEMKANVSQSSNQKSQNANKSKVEQHLNIEEERKENEIDNNANNEHQLLMRQGGEQNNSRER